MPFPIGCQYTVSPKSDYIFYNNFNDKCPITILFGIVSSKSMRLTTNYAKNYCNRTLIVKVIVENVVTCFLGTQCSNFCYRMHRLAIIDT